MILAAININKAFHILQQEKIGLFRCDGGQNGIENQPTLPLFVLMWDLASILHIAQPTLPHMQPTQTQD